jgi:fatty acid desaturase
MLQPADSPQGRLSLARARHVIADLFTPKPAVYYTDFLISALIGNVCFAICLAAVRDWSTFAAAWPLALRVFALAAAYVTASLAFYRMSMFIHELVHIRTGKMLGFRTLWNLLCGIPFLMPSFVYYTHLDHHRRRHYGTELDGEYVPFGQESRWSIIKHLLMNFFVPPAVVVRFLIVGPLSWVVSPLRKWILSRASSMVIDYGYERPLPTKKEAWIIFLQEFACFAWLLGIFVGVPLVLHRWPIPFLVCGYAVGVFILQLNAIRTLGSHRWANDGHEEMTFEEQLLDSVNVHQHPLITELWGPIGTRYHALHHLFPGLPYHAMAEAHRRLTAELPPDSPYHQTEEPSLTAALIDLWRRSAEAGRRKAAATE